MSGPPRVTVIILSHRAKFLPGALDSVFAQTEQDIQVVVQYCKKCWRPKLNEAVSIAHGEFIVILCDDDLLAPTFLEECLKRAQHADMIYTDRLCFEDGQDPQQGFRVRQLGEHFTEETAGPKGYFTTQFPPELFTFGSTLPMTCMIRRTLWEKLKGYDPDMPHGDTEFWARASFEDNPKCRFVYVPQPLFWYRSHPEQYSKTYKNSLQDAMSAYHRKHFLRYGVCWDLGRHLEDDKWEVVMVPPEEREAVMNGVDPLSLIRSEEPVQLLGAGI